MPVNNNMSSKNDKNNTKSKSIVTDLLGDIEKVDGANDLSPYSQSDVLDASKLLIKDKRIEEAQVLLENALKKWPLNGPINGVIADCYCKSGRLVESAKHFEIVFDNTKKKPYWALVGFANVQEKLGNYATAIQYLAQALDEKFSLELAKRAIRLCSFGMVGEELTISILNNVNKNTNVKEKSRELCVLGDEFMSIGQYSLGVEFYTYSEKADADNLIPVRRKIKYFLKSGLVERARLAIASWKDSHRNQDQLKRFENICAKSAVANTVRTVAFYLPQFHPIPENSEWWGEGFTEWQNVASTKSMWNGHTQPRLPTDLGYYDLRLPETYDKQTTLATEYGIDGFCFYYYWFNGRKILEKPVQNILDGKTKPFPFCICWVNEDWTRSWDGMTGEVLLSTEHSEEMNARFIEDVYHILADPNYIRIENKPVLIVYCAEKLDKTNKTTNQWRDYCRSRGLGEIYITAVQSFGFGDPSELGYDAALEFPPHAIPSGDDRDSHVEIDRPDGLVDGFSGKVYSYQNFADCAMSRGRENYNLHRTCMLAWDNSARRGKQAHVYAHFSVNKYQEWLVTNMRKAMVEQSDPVVFVNAWNEWAEGSVLEPDTEYGHELLAASKRSKRISLWNCQETYWNNDTYRPLISEESGNEKVLMIGHDAHKNGAQINFLCMLQNLVRTKKKRVTVILKEGGDLLPQYEQYGKVYVIGQAENKYDIFNAIIRDYYGKGATKAICNTCVTGDFTELLSKNGYSVISLVHELPKLIQQYGLEGNCLRLAEHSDAVVFASEYVAEKFKEVAEVNESKVYVYPQGIKSNPYISKKEEIRGEVRAELGISKDSKIVVGCGYGDIRKGIDLFVRVASATVQKNDKIKFVWIGEIDAGLNDYLQRDIEELPKGSFHVTGYREDTGRLLLASDIFALTSREDPFPSVVMEAMEAGLAVFGFENCGGYQSIVTGESGGIVPFGDIDAYANELSTLLARPEKLGKISKRNSTVALETFGYSSYLDRLLEILHKGFVGPAIENKQKVSVIIPNYNYAQYLNLRLKTVIEQSRKPDEIIILDDASTDKSIEVIEKYISDADCDIRVVTNEVNSGNLFLQWKKGIEMATGDLIWIAEADDYCDQDFLARMCSEMSAKSTSMAFSNSIMVDEFGASHGADYSDYYRTQFDDYLSNSFTKSGSQFVNDVMTKRNAVVNASAVVFRRDAAKLAIEKLGSLALSGDWLFWIEVCMKGDISYVSDSYNYHRRHRKSVVGKALQKRTEVVQEMVELLVILQQEYGDQLNANSYRIALSSIEGTYDELFSQVDSTQVDSTESILDHVTLGPEFQRFVKVLDLPEDKTTDIAVVEPYRMAL